MPATLSVEDIVRAHIAQVIGTALSTLEDSDPMNMDVAFQVVGTVGLALGGKNIPFPSDPIRTVGELVAYFSQFDLEA